MMRVLTVIAAVVVLGCNGDDGPAAPVPVPGAELVGVWQAVSVDGEALPWTLPSGEDVMVAQVVLDDARSGEAMLGLWQECLRTVTELGTRMSPRWYDLRWESSGDEVLRITWRGPDAAHLGIQDDGQAALDDEESPTLAITRTAGLGEPGAAYLFERISTDPDDRASVCDGVVE